MSATVTIEDLGDKVKISGLGTAPSKIAFPKNSTTYVRQNTGSSGSEEYFRLYSNGIGRSVDLKASEIVSPTVADADALEGVLDSYFFNSASSVAKTYSVLLADIQNGDLPTGKWVFVSDICDQGAWFLCTSPTTLARQGQGLFLNCDENIEADADWSSLYTRLEFDPQTVTGGAFNEGDTLSVNANSWEGTLAVLSDGVMQVKWNSFITAPGDFPAIGYVVSNGTANAVITAVTEPASPYLPFTQSSGRWHRQAEGFVVSGDTLDFKVEFNQLLMTGTYPSRFAINDIITEGAWSGEVKAVGDNYVRVTSLSALGVYPVIGNVIDNGTHTAVITGISSAMEIDDAVSSPSGFTGAVVYVNGLDVSMAPYNFGPGYSFPLVGETVTSSSNFDMVAATVGGQTIYSGDVFIDFDTVTNRFRHYQLVDVGLSNTGSPSTATTDIWQPLPFQDGFGYIPVSDEIEFDFEPTDSITNKGWLASRKDGLADIRYPFSLDQAGFFAGYSQVLAYRWGRQEWRGVEVKGLFLPVDCYLHQIDGLDVGYGANLQASDCVGATLANARIGAGSTVNIFIAEGKGIDGLDVTPNVTFTNQRFIEDVDNLVVAKSETTPRTLSYAPDNPVEVVTDITSAQLLGTNIGENIDSGIVLVPGVLHGYPFIKTRLEFYYGTSQYAGPTTFQIKGARSGAVLASFSTTAVKSAANQILSITMAVGNGTNVEEDVIIATSNATPFSGGDGTVRLITEYTRHYLA